MAQSRDLGGSTRKGRSSDTPSKHKNVSGFVDISLNMERLRCQATNLASPRRIIATGDAPLRLAEWVSFTHEMRLLGFSVSRFKQSRPTMNLHHNNRSQTNRIPTTDGQKRSWGCGYKCIIHKYLNFHFKWFFYQEIKIDSKDIEITI